MGKKAIFQTVGAILLGGNVAIPMALDAQDLFPDWPYQYYELIGFLAFVIFVGWIIFSKQSDINKFEHARPQITVEPTVHNDRAFLEVHNTGGEAYFTATARIFSSTWESELVTMVWDANKEKSCHIDNNGRASILVGEKSLVTDEAKHLIAGGIKLHRMGKLGDEVFGAMTMERTPPKEQPNAEMYTLLDKCIVEMEIVSTPPLKKNLGSKRYTIEALGSTVSFINESTPDTEDSQTE